MSELPSTSRAVFLSYAREDAEPARRVADALRAFGVEVWFDQNELRGGDAWDQKLRNQIKDCALFLPIVSATTQARAEGYFRREWRLAVDRTHDIAAGVAFILPLVIDETTEAEAMVPDEFMRFQWTRLPHGVPSPEFVGHVKSILDNPRKPAAKSRTGATNPAHGATNDSSRGKKSGRSPVLWVVAGIVLVVIAGLIFRPRRSPQEVAELIAAARALGDSTAAKTAAETKPAPVEPAAPAVARIEAKSVAVLPFENMSEDKDANAFFADGVHEDILTNLSFIRDLHVISRTSVMQYKGTTKSIGQIARELNVAYLLEGSVRRAGNKVRVTGQLIKAATDEHVWAKAYDRDITDVFAIQSELAQAIAAALQTAISPAEKSILDRKPTENPRAYDLYVKARHDYNNNGVISFEKVEADLLEAVQLDPGFAEAWALLGAIHASQRFNEYDATPDRLDKARSAIETAVRLAPDDPIVIQFHGDYFYYGYRDYTRAAEQYRRLLELQPNSPDAYGSLGLIYRRQGRWADTVANLRKAVELDPHNIRYRTTLVSQLAAMRQFDQAEEEARAMAAANPDNFNIAGQVYGISFQRTGSLREIADFLARTKPKPGEEPLAREDHKQVLRLQGNYAEALRIDLTEPAFPDAPKWQTEFAIAVDALGAGHEAGATERMKKLLPELQAQLKSQPANSTLWSLMGQAQAFLGQRDEALLAAAKLRELLPESSDAVGGPPQSRNRAIILAWAGEKEEALAEFARLLQVPYGTDVHGDPPDVAWRPLRDDPRFQALLKDPKNNEPIN